MNHKHSKMQKHDHHRMMMEDFKRRFIVSTILTVPLLFLSEGFQKVIGIQLPRLPYSNYILTLLATVIFAYGGFPFLKGLIKELKAHQPGMMTLIGIAISVAYFYSIYALIIQSPKDLFWELSTLIDIMLLGHWIEMRSVMGASQALNALVALMPAYAHLLVNGKIIKVPIGRLKKNDIVIVKPGEKIPSDGIVVEGESYVNEALITGESKPVYKKPGDVVIGGSINGDGMLKIRITKIGEETFLSQVIKLVKEAQESKSKTQDLANKAAFFLTVTAITVGLLTLVSWIYILNDSSFALERMVAVMVTTCPHALGLAIPLVVAISTSISAGKGILVRDRRAFEELRNVNAIVFDKTGTLTKGEFGLTDIVVLDSNVNADKVLKIAASLERFSEHTIAKSVTKAAEQRKLNLLEIKDFRAIPGKGVYGRIGSSEVYVGSRNLVEELGLKIKSSEIEKAEKEGKTVVYVIMDGKLIGALALADIIRKESFYAVKELKQLGLKVFMLTGDSEEVAKWVAEKLEIDDYFARVLPGEKADKIKQLQRKGFKVAMVGDGINDAPALMQADVGIAIGAGTDVAIESADIILVRNNPEDVVDAIKISKATYSKMLQNLLWATGYNVITIPLAAGVLYNAGILLTPAIGAILMSLSTVIVALNSQTLRKLVKLKPEA